MAIGFVRCVRLEKIKILHTCPKVPAIRTMIGKILLIYIEIVFNVEIISSSAMLSRKKIKDEEVCSDVIFFSYSITNLKEKARRIFVSFKHYHLLLIRTLSLTCNYSSIINENVFLDVINEFSSFQFFYPTAKTTAVPKSSHQQVHRRMSAQWIVNDPKNRAELHQTLIQNLLRECNDGVIYAFEIMIMRCWSKTKGIEYENLNSKVIVSTRSSSQMRHLKIRNFESLINQRNNYIVFIGDEGFLRRANLLLGGYTLREI